MRFKYTNEHLTFLEKEFKKTPMPELVNVFNEKFGLNKSDSQIHSALTNHKIRCGRKVGLPKGHSRLFTHLQKQFIAEKYQLHTAKKVAYFLNRAWKSNFTEQQIKSFVKNHGINCPRTGHFESGKGSWNKGTKGVMKPNSGNFKKGNIPYNHHPVGKERLTKDGYRSIKVAEPNKWELLQRRNWALVHGYENMPENLRFKDGDRLNCDIENLEPVTNQEHMILNHLGYNNMPDEIKPVVLNIAKIDVKTYNLKKEVA